MVKARVSGVPYEVDLPSPRVLTNEEIDSVWKTEYFNLHYELPRAVEALIASKHAEEIATLEHEIKLVRARNERLEREANNPLP
jgi:hypothetical protein